MIIVPRFATLFLLATAVSSKALALNETQPVVFLRELNGRVATVAAASPVPPPTYQKHPIKLSMFVVEKKGKYDLMMHGLWPRENCPEDACSSFHVPKLGALWSICDPKHEFKKHGCCHYKNVDDYFVEAAAMARTIKHPTSYLCPTDAKKVTIGGKKAISRCKAGKLSELRFCFQAAKTWVECTNS
ncbi:Aste57867_2153 [Aphanomyces stellatus]|uniref:Aste57867_1928 protein n=1 Tax=Aphanomyces stellatus TaxID=120398 RepID=A0A485K7L8_9STRA|nr:hypothetical protein As57867_002148 [Aphanomyces stellatus]KAF0718050.1 hypothetical protein As57867_001926 [Aphanomyces stellatus]KAF0718058.1 hypothetical protein As57867_001934 [Aphanomyces stellatus]VFT79133.1 Aste57867_1928 [Aphanomyces stellatus]VFT79141.1 Aste57867_1936 [Aphanomyces stellatus]